MMKEKVKFMKEDWEFILYARSFPLEIAEQMLVDRFSWRVAAVCDSPELLYFEIEENLITFEEYLSLNKIRPN